MQKFLQEIFMIKHFGVSWVWDKIIWNIMYAGILFGHSLRSWHRGLKSISSALFFFFPLGTPVYKTLQLQLDTSRSEISFCLTKPVYIHFEATAPEDVLSHSTAASVIAPAEVEQVSPRGSGGSWLSGAVWNYSFSSSAFMWLCDSLVRF